MGKVKIAIIGGGNMGSTLAVKFSQKHDVCLYLNSPKKEKYHNDMRIFNEDSNSFVFGKINKITESLTEAVENANWIVITFPSFMFQELSEKLIPILKNGQHLLFVPGSGGAELFFMDAIKKGCTISGLQRVHSVARITEQGVEVRESGVRKTIRVASIPKSFNEEACETVSDFYSLPVEKLNNYLNITLINSNPILHTSRLYSIFKDYNGEKSYETLPLFYEQWDDESSKLLLKMDNELFTMIDKMKDYNVIVDQIIPLLDHYESSNFCELTKKINSIKSLKGLKTPSVLSNDGKLLPDFSSRYFTADFSYGLDILLSFATMLKTDNKAMKTVSEWYHKVSKTKNIFNLKKFGIAGIYNMIDIYC